MNTKIELLKLAVELTKITASQDKLSQKELENTFENWVNVVVTSHSRDQAEELFI